MLFEPGPIDPLLETQIPELGPRGVFTRLIASDVAALEAGARGLSTSAATLAPALDGAPELASGSTLAVAAAEHARHVDGADSAIGSIAADAGTLEGALEGLTSELVRELANAAAPDEPELPPNVGGIGPSPRDDFDTIVRGWYIAYLGREPSEEELEAHRQNPDGLPGVQRAIVESDEYRERYPNGIPFTPPGGTPPPLLPPPPSSGGGGDGGDYLEGTEELVRAYADAHPTWRDAIERFAAANGGDWHRLPRALELPGWNSFVRGRG